MSAASDNSMRTHVAEPLLPFVEALRLSLDDPRGAPCELADAGDYLVVRAPNGGEAIALWSSTRDDDLEDIVADVARRRPPVSIGIAHVPGPISEQVLSRPTPAGTRWLFAWPHGARTEFAPWGGQIDSKLLELLQVERAAAALRHVREELEKHFGDPMQLYFTPDALTSSSLSPTMLANAVRLVVEGEFRWQLLDLDGQAVAARRLPSPPLQPLVTRLWMAITGGYKKVGELTSRARSLDEARLTLAVRADRTTQRLDQLRQSEWKLNAESQAAHESSRRALIAGQVQAVRGDVQRLSARLEIIHAQQHIAEAQLRSIDLHGAASGRRLPPVAELATQAAAARSFLAHVRDLAALEKAVDDAIAADAASSPPPRGARSHVPAPQPAAGSISPEEPPTTPDPFESQALEFLSEPEDDEPGDGPPRTVQLA